MSGSPDCPVAVPVFRRRQFITNRTSRRTNKDQGKMPVAFRREKVKKKEKEREGGRKEGGLREREGGGRESAEAGRAAGQAELE